MIEMKDGFVTLYEPTLTNLSPHILFLFSNSLSNEGYPPR